MAVKEKGKVFIWRDFPYLYFNLYQQQGPGLQGTVSHGAGLQGTGWLVGSWVQGSGLHGSCEDAKTENAEIDPIASTAANNSFFII